MTRLNVEDLEGRALMSAVVPLSNPVSVEAAIYMKVDGVDGSVVAQEPVGGESVQRSGSNIVQTYPATEYFTAPIGSNKGSFAGDGLGVDEGAWGVNNTTALGTP